MSSNKGDSPITIEMYNPNNDSVMVEVYECVGEIVFEATADYRKFMDNEAAGQSMRRRRALSCEDGSH
jgi:hypothetical protein